MTQAAGIGKESDRDFRSAGVSLCKSPQVCLSGPWPFPWQWRKPGWRGETWSGGQGLLRKGSPVWDHSSGCSRGAISCRSPLPFSCSVTNCSAGGGMLSACPHSCFSYFHSFEGGSRTFCSSKIDIRAASVQASCPSQMQLIRNSLQNRPHLDMKTGPLSTIYCLEISSYMKTVLGFSESSARGHPQYFILLGSTSWLK